MHEVVEQNDEIQRLRAGEANVWALVDAVEDSYIFRLDSDRQVVTWNRGAQRIHGYHASEILGHPFSRLYTSEDGDLDVPANHVKFALGRGRYQDEGWRVRKYGFRFWAHEDNRLPQTLETTLFRSAPESLTNIHRHSGSSTAQIRLLTDAESVILEGRDEGRGMPGASLQRCDGGPRVPGVGIAGMRERVRQFGGKLEIQSTLNGTTVRVTLPVGGEACMHFES
jgi:PAS domain S-box-containing protein